MKNFLLVSAITTMLLVSGITFPALDPVQLSIQNNDLAKANIELTKDNKKLESKVTELQFWGFWKDMSIGALLVKAFLL